jgi:hypothetical protein
VNKRMNAQNLSQSGRVIWQALGIRR